MNNTHTQGNAFSPALGSRILSYADDDAAIDRNIYDIPDYSEPATTPAPQVSFSGFLKSTFEYKRRLVGASRGDFNNASININQFFFADIGGRTGRDKTYAR